MATYLFPLRSAKRRARVKDAIESSRAQFEEAVIRAESLPADAAQLLRRRQLVDYVRAALTAIVAKVDTDDSGKLEDAASDLARLRAFVLPFSELAAEAQSSVSELRQWHVPQEALAQAQQFLAEITQADRNEQRVRAAFNELIATYDYWSWYIDWYFDQLTVAAIVLAVVAVAGVGGAVAALGRSHATFGFLLAGLGGTATSILIKLPPLSVYGDAASFWIRIVARMGSGLVAAAVGLGLLGSNVVNLTLGDARISEALRCVQASASEPATPAAAATAAAAQPVVPSEGAAADAAAPSSIGAARPAPVDARPRDPCGRSSTLFILSVAILIGFSERALSSFEQAVFGSNGNAAPRPPPAANAPTPSPASPNSDGEPATPPVVAVAPARLQGGVTVEPHARVPAPRELAGPDGSFKNPAPRRNP